MPATTASLTIDRTNIRVRRAAIVLLGNALLWASAKAQVPFWPVPITMQTYVVLTLGALLGWRIGAATLAAYLAEGAMGMPVFAGTPANGLGLAYMTGPTGGYLAGYLAAVIVVGVLADRGWTRSRVGSAAALLAGELAILGLGWAWLAIGLGAQKAAAAGIAPFLIGDALKLGLAIVTIGFAGRFKTSC
jgi:biotin transport system substrate-specific component